MSSSLPADLETQGCLLTEAPLPNLSRHRPLTTFQLVEDHSNSAVFLVKEAHSKEELDLLLLGHDGLQ